MTGTIKRPKAIASGTLFGGLVDCYVLDDGRRVLSQRGIVKALTGGNETGNLGQYLERLPNKNDSLTMGTSIEFQLPQGGIALGREATWFAEFCDCYIDAFFAGELHPKQIVLAHRARALAKSFFKVGIIAVVDEATNYQEVRARNELQQRFGSYLLTEASKYQPIWKVRGDVVSSLCRVFRIEHQEKGIPAPLMGVIGKIYRNYLSPEVHAELKRRNPGGNQRDIHTQWFTSPAVEQLRVEMNVIRGMADISSSKKQFWERLQMYFKGGKGQFDMAV